MDQHIGASKYERTEERTGLRNGHRSRTFKTRIGTLELSVPLDRDGTFDPGIFEKYQRSEKAFVSAMAEMYLKGVSTRKVSKIVEELCGFSFSKSQISNMVKSLDEEVSLWRKRELEYSYPMLVVDARYEKIRIGKRVESNAILTVVGISELGYREILGVWVTNSENEFSWGDAFRELKDRGLTGVKYIVSDAHEGLKKAINKHFIGVLWQRCFVHFLRNLICKTSVKQRDKVISLMQTLKNLTDINDARDQLKIVIERLEENKLTNAAEMLDENGEDIIAFYLLPEAYRKRMYTSNMIERLMQEYKRRSRVVRIFPNESSCLRLIGALSIEFSEQWQSKRYFNMDSFQILDDVKDNKKEGELMAA